MIQTHKDLTVWKKSLELVLFVYEKTKLFPKEELYGLSMQMRRASVSIPSNIAEGYGRFSNKELVRFLFISLGSAAELETHLIIALQLGFLPKEDYENVNDQLVAIIKMLTSLIKVKNNGQLNIPE